MTRVSLASVLATFVLCGACPAEEKKLCSGPQKGEAITPFPVIKVIDTENSEKTTVKPRKSKTTFVVFFHQVTEPGMLLLMTVDWFASQQKDIDRHYVLLSADKAEAEKRAKRWSSRALFTDSKWCVSEDGLEGPGRYGLNRRAVMTILVAKNNVVVSNFALTQPNNTDAPAILAAVAKAVGKPTPSYKTVRAGLSAYRQKQRNQRIAQNPIVKLAPNKELGRLMIAMIYREGINQEIVEKASKAMTKWAGDDKKRKAQIVKYSKAILKGTFRLNRYSREGLEKLAKE